MAGVAMGNLPEFPLQGTPTLLVGDEVVQGALPYAQLREGEGERLAAPHQCDAGPRGRRSSAPVEPR